MGTTTYDFAGETVVVTGGSSGIGRATALSFGAAGATVLVADVRTTPKDVTVNNAGITVGRPTVEVTPAELDRLHAANVRGVFSGCRAAAVDTLDRGEPGVILNTASIGSDLARGNAVQYEATRGAVRTITRGAALEFADRGVRVNAAAPGQIATEIVEGWTERARETARSGEALKPVPLGRAGRPEDVADAFLYLASDAASYVTGALLHVDGGWQTC